MNIQIKILILCHFNAYCSCIIEKLQHEKSYLIQLTAIQHKIANKRCIVHLESILKVD